jgi:catechol 2,3-dioxygenase-like lactoylglutathione lyase family enzyme
LGGTTSDRISEQRGRSLIEGFAGVPPRADIPPMPRRFDHIDLRVPDLAQVSDFYRKLLPALGFKKALTVPGWLQYYAEGEGATEFFGVTESRPHVPNENRIAFWASSVDEVNDISRFLHEIGARNIEGPEFEESPTYYAVFFEDPAGNRLELCYRRTN